MAWLNQEITDSDEDIGVIANTSKSRTLSDKDRTTEEDEEQKDEEQKDEDQIDSTPNIDNIPTNTSSTPVTTPQLLQAWAMYKGLNVRSVGGYEVLLKHIIEEFKDLEKENEDLRLDLEHAKTTMASTDDLQTQLGRSYQLSEKVWT
ncbi:hypothetical protein R1sor_013285 [Riccia sorocarpa]|uniref:Uncharacterized protein n=1 Tax=Riccia sorocarpa TaxID=122646 RepID=A0ABD3H7Z2_9MARC